MVTDNQQKRKEVPKLLIIAAAAALIKKLRQEAKLFKSVKRHFDKYTKETFSHYAKYGHTPSNIDVHQRDMEKILKTHYQDTASKFKNTIREKIGDPKNNINIEKQLVTTIKHHGDTQSHLTAHQIASTTRDQTAEMIKRTIVNSAVEKIELNNKEIAKQAGDDFYSNAFARSMLIATTETQTAAETTKDDELNTLIDGDAVFEDEDGQELSFATADISKMRVAILDEKTREAHAEADGQEVAIDEPFNVGGEDLMFPGDDSLGASSENLINCRCSKEIVYK